MIDSVISIGSAIFHSKMNMFAICQADCVSEQGFKRIQQ